MSHQIIQVICHIKLIVEFELKNEQINKYTGIITHGTSINDIIIYIYD